MHKYKNKGKLNLSLEIEEITEIPYANNKVCDSDLDICTDCFKAMVLSLLANALISLQ